MYAIAKQLGEKEGARYFQILFIVDFTEDMYLPIHHLDIYGLSCKYDHFWLPIKRHIPKHDGWCTVRRAYVYRSHVFVMQTNRG